MDHPLRLSMFKINQPARNILTDVINHSNRLVEGFVPYNHGELTFRHVQDEADGGDGAASVMVSDTDSPEDNEWKRIFYHKVSITTFIPPTTPSFGWRPEYVDVHSMLQDINRQLGICLADADIINNIVDTDLALDGTLVVPIISQPNALLIRGGTGITLTGVPAKKTD